MESRIKIGNIIRARIQDVLIEVLEFKSFANFRV